MRSHKVFFMSATMLASVTLAGVSFADNTTPAGKTPTAPGATTGSTSTSTSSSTVMTPSSPSAPTTSTTTTTQGTPGATPVPAPMPGAPTTSTTTITSADETLPVTPSVPVMGSTTSAPPRDMTLYSKRTPNKAVLITGGSLFVSTYVTTAALAAANGPTADKDLFIPVVGPWINLADRDTNREDNSRDTALIVGSGVLQGVGAAMLISSFFIPEKVPTARISAGNVKMNVTPTAGPGAGGIGAVGTF